MNVLHRRSPAKLNLTLRVLGRRPDGYHDIESLVVRIGLFDEVSVQSRPDGQMTLSCDDPSLPLDEHNLALRAANELAKRAGAAPRGAQIQLRKRIPAGAGLGGGSSNAAATLWLLNQLWSLNLDDADLAQCGARIGSDVPLFLASPVCIVRGRGVEIEELALRPRGYAVLALPATHSGTSAVYAAWQALRDQSPQRGSLAETVAAIAHSPRDAVAGLFNDLEPAAHAVSPALADFAARLGGLELAEFRMSGSGAAYFTLSDDEPAAQTLAARVAAALDVRTEVAALAVE